VVASPPARAAGHLPTGASAPLVTRLTALDRPQSRHGPGPKGYATPVEGKTTYTIDEAAAVLGETPARIQEMLHTGELEGIRPAATVSGRWKVFLPTSAGEDPGQEAPAEQDAEAAQEDQEERPADQQLAQSPPDEPEEHADFVAPPAASDAAVRIPDEISDEPLRDPGEDVRSGASESGWTTTKQAAKVLGVSRRSVQGYVRRGLLEAQEEGEGVNKTFLVSIDSLNALRDRRSREAGVAAKFSEASAEEEQRASLYANTGEVLRHAIERVEARTAEATELRIRLELTEQAESTLRAELEETRRRRDEVEREREEVVQERDELRRELEALRERRESRVSPSPSETTAEERTDSQEARETTQSAAETLRGPEPQPTTPGPQASPQRPPQAGRRRGRLWRRVFGR
jgi:hypothetical protein